MQTLAALPLGLLIVSLTAGQLQDKIMSSETTQDFAEQKEKSFTTSQSPLSLSSASAEAGTNTLGAKEAIDKDSMEESKPKFDIADRSSKATSDISERFSLKKNNDDEDIEFDNWLTMMLFSAPIGDNRPVRRFPMGTTLPFPDLPTERTTPNETPTRETTPKMSTRGMTLKMSTGGTTPKMSTRETTLQIVQTSKLWSTAPWIHHPAKTLDSVPKSSTDDDGSEIHEYEEDEFGIYTLAHFRHELYDYVNEKLSDINGTVVSELRKMQEKLTRVENQLSKNIAYTQLLESQIKSGKDLKRGDLRLVVAGKERLGAKFGYLQYYTGTEWGFVCDDFFNAAAQKVACKQIGPTEPSDAFKTDPALPESAAGEGSVQKLWKKQFSIALDDVICSGSEESLDSCHHSEVGKHDCSLDEIVFLVC